MTFYMGIILCGKCRLSHKIPGSFFIVKTLPDQPTTHTRREVAVWSNKSQLSGKMRGKILEDSKKSFFHDNCRLSICHGRFL